MIDESQIWFPQGEWVDMPAPVLSADEHEAWLEEERKLRIARGDTAIDDSPLPTIPFVWKD